VLRQFEYRNRPTKEGPKRTGFMGWIDSAVMWALGVAHPAMLLAGVLGLALAVVFTLGLSDRMYSMVMGQFAEMPSGARESTESGISEGRPTVSESEAVVETHGRLSGVVYYRSLDAHRPAKGAGTESSPPQDTEWVTEAEYEATRPEGQPEHTPSAGSVIYVYPATTAGAASPAQGADGSGQPPGVRGDGSSPDPIAEGVVDTRGRYWIDDIAPGQYDVYCYNANHADTGEWVWREVHFGIGWCEPVHSASPWAYRANVQVPAGGEVSVDFRFE